MQKKQRNILFFIADFIKIQVINRISDINKFALYTINIK